MVKRELVDRYRRYVGLWKWFYALLLLGHFALGGASVIAPALIASDLFGSANETTAKILALTGAVSAALVAFLRPSQYAQGFYSAYSLLETACDRYEDSTRPDAEASLVHAMESARILIGAVQPSQAQSSMPATPDDGT